MGGLALIPNPLVLAQPLGSLGGCSLHHHQRALGLLAKLVEGQVDSSRIWFGTGKWHR